MIYTIRRSTLFVTFLAWLAIVVILFAGILRGKDKGDLRKEAETVNEAYLGIEEQIIKVISDPRVTSKLITDSYTFQEFTALTELPFGLATYIGDSAVMWTNNAIIPVDARPGNDDRPLFISETNGSYVLFQHLFDQDIRTMAFLLLQADYGIENEYLTNLQPRGMEIPSFFSVQADEQPGAYPVVSAGLETIFYLVPDATVISSGGPVGGMAIPVLLFMVLTLWIGYLIIIRVFEQNKHILPVLLILVMLVYMLVEFGLQSFLGQTPLFDPTTYGAGFPLQSLVELFLVCAGILMLSYHVVFGIDKKSIGRWGRVALSAVIVLLLSLIIFVTNGLVRDSSIVFAIDEIFSYDLYTLVALLSVANLSLATGLLCNRLITIHPHRKPEVWISMLSVAALIFFLVFGLYNPLTSIFLPAFLVSAVFVLLFSMFRVRPSSLPVHLTWLVVFSVLIAYTIGSAMFDKAEENKRLFAYKKSNEKDALAEFLFNEQMENVHRMLDLQFTGTKEGVVPIRQGLVNQIRQQFEGNYFKKFETDVYIFYNGQYKAGNGKLSGNNPGYFIDAIENNGEYTSTVDLYFINDYTGNYYYLAELQSGSEKDVITAYIALNPRRFNSESLYPELLVDDELRFPKGYEDLNYAIYYNNHLIERKGDYSYPVMDVFYVPRDQEWADASINGYDHFIHVVNDLKKVVVSDPDRKWSELVAYFSFLFIFFLLFYGLVSFLRLTLVYLSRGSPVMAFFETSLKNKIQLAIVFLVVFTFLALGTATVVYITGQYDQDNEHDLLEKIEAVKTSISQLEPVVKRTGLAGDRVLPGVRISSRISELSEVHDMDINLYNRNGLLAVSSQPDIFEKGLISVKMNPLAYFKMTCEKETWYIHRETIGKLSFLSAYVPLLDSEGEVEYYLNLPYFATEKDLQQEISSFLITLVNVYVFILVISALIALVVSRNITGPLATIAGTFKKVQLGKKNEVIEWPHPDEIGLLVTEYNSMLLELERSARLLANTERESAWRDMAKQVAHEIKNPLTPMRLSIQHLQRAIDQERPDVNELTRKVTRTLMEQIDSLAFIASEFSNFAVMPKANNEVVDMNEMVSSTVDLFEQSNRAEIELTLTEKPTTLFIDRNQFMRVCNNLLKNALQAIPEDEEGHITVKTEGSDEKVLLVVQDNGHGIPDDVKEKVFVPNFTTKSSGMGIGLALSKNIIDNADGHIWFESEEGEGTTFFVELPLYKNQ